MCYMYIHSSDTVHTKCMRKKIIVHEHCIWPPLPPSHIHTHFIAPDVACCCIFHFTSFYSFVPSSFDFNQSKLYARGKKIGNINKVPHLNIGSRWHIMLWCFLLRLLQVLNSIRCVYGCVEHARTPYKSTDFIGHFSVRSFHWFHQRYSQGKCDGREHGNNCSSSSPSVHVCVCVCGSAIVNATL